MNKRFVSALMCMVLLLSLALPAYAAQTEDSEPPTTQLRISGISGFQRFVSKCRLDAYSQNLVVSLERDLDLSGVEFDGIPTFSGTFCGNGHTISGLEITADGSAQGLFRYLTETAVVQDLNVQGNIHPGGSRNEIGGIAGINDGSILNCSFTGTLSGGDNIGGLVGKNTVTGILENCRSFGEVHGDHFVGGIAGVNNGVIRSCSNSAGVNTTAQQNTVSLSDITIDTLTNSEAVNTVTDIGGIAGSSSGVIRSCINRGDVGYQHMGYNIGGIAGTQSGYISNCQNYAAVRGRKEVGGIAGQMEPVSLIEYTKDTLQILKEQLSTMSGLVNKASKNAQSNAGEISGQIGTLQDQAQTAWDAMDSMWPDSLESFDLDSILAAQSTFSSAISSMPGTINSIASAANSTIKGLTRDMQAISSQISAMSRTINEASENLGGSITDISDQDTPELLTGKVEDCSNYGTVLADRNAGGIAGAMAMENDLDILEDWQEYGEESLNFESKVRAVILNCENQGTVTGKKQNIGGIAGWQHIGLVSGCTNTGILDAEGAEYVGGISGTSTGFIRSCNAKCEIYGDTYVGGIAGSAAIVTDCRTMVALYQGSEKLGTILGDQETRRTTQTAGEETEDPITGNFYLSVLKDIGAIDGISYAGLAEPLKLEDFLALENLSNCFRTVTLRFRFGDDTERRISLPLGGTLDSARIPVIPAKKGYEAHWEGLDDASLKNISFDRTFEAVYTAHNAVIQSDATRNSLPILLVQGDFTEDAAVSICQSGAEPVLADGQTPAEIWEVQISQPEKASALRLMLPDSLDADRASVLVCGADGQWQETDCTVDGRYLVFPWNSQDTAVAVVEAASTNWLLPTLGIVLAAACAAVIVTAVKKRKGSVKNSK